MNTFILTRKKTLSVAIGGALFGALLLILVGIYGALVKTQVATNDAGVVASGMLETSRFQAGDYTLRFTGSNGQSTVVATRQFEIVASPTPTPTPTPTITPTPFPDTPTPLPPTPTTPSTPSTKNLLSASDFTYLGVVRLPAAIGQSVEGFTYRASTNTYFVIGRAGKSPYYLYEVRLSSPRATIADAVANPATIVRYYGSLNVGGRLDVQGELVRMEGLHWDEAKSRLWFAFGSFYTNVTTNPVMGYATLDATTPWTGSFPDGFQAGTPTGTSTVYGPWKVSGVPSDLVKGMILEAPQALQSITGNRFVMFGPRGSVAQQQSWGPGLVSVAEPMAGQAPLSNLNAFKLIHWPMLRYDASPTAYTTYSGFLRAPGDADTPTILGNDRVGNTFRGTARGGSATTIDLGPLPVEGGVEVISPNRPFPFNSLAGNKHYVKNLTTGEQIVIASWDQSTKIATLATPWTLGVPVSGTLYEVYLASYEHSEVIRIPGAPKYQADDGLDHAVWIDLPTKHGLIYFGRTALGYTWYGNPMAHRDVTANGVLRDNNYHSLLDPSQWLTSISPHVGRHAEASVPRFYIMDPAKILSNATRAMQGTVTASDLQVSWASAGDVKNLKQQGNPSVQLDNASFGDMSFDAATGKLMVISPEGWQDGGNARAIINVWQINPN